MDTYTNVVSCADLFNKWSRASPYEWSRC